MVGEAADFAPSTRFVVFPLNLNGSSNITTAISEVSSAKKAKTIRYFNTLGFKSSHPFKGFNIMMTTHTDGTTTAKKSSTNPHTQIPHKIPLVSEKSHSPKQSA